MTDGVGGEGDGTHLYCLNLIRPGNCWVCVWHSGKGRLREDVLTWCDAPSAIKPADRPPPPHTDIHIISSQSDWLCCPVFKQLIFVSQQAASLSLLPRFTAIITHSFSLTGMNTHSYKLSPLVLSHYLTEHQQILCLRARQSLVWMVERLDLISAAPIWISKETGARTTRQYVTFLPDQLLTSPSVACRNWCTHQCTHEGGLGAVQLYNQVISLL